MINRLIGSVAIQYQSPRSVECQPARRLDRQASLGGLRAGDAIAGEQQPFGLLGRRAGAPTGCRFAPPHPCGRVAGSWASAAAIT